jgi:hypothetical protein
MTSNDIYTLLSSKPHNLHYLGRYHKFILSFQHQKKEVGVTERHHICPKSNDLFPNHKSFRTYKWNSVYLTKRQHFIAHHLLAKAYGGKQIYAFWAMCNKQSPNDIRTREYKVTSRLYEKIKIEISKLISPNKNMGIYRNKDGIIIRTNILDVRVLSGEFVGHSKGRAAYKNTNGDIITMSTSDPRVVSGEFVAESKGRIPHNKLKFSRIQPCIICNKYHTNQGKTCSKICSLKYQYNLRKL